MKVAKAHIKAFNKAKAAAELPTAVVAFRIPSHVETALRKEASREGVPVNVFVGAIVERVLKLSAAKRARARAKKKAGK